jgi:hypothetical protein
VKFFIPLLLLTTVVTAEDPIILKLAGLRTGLCQMIDKKQITHEQGTDIWEDERQRSIVDRSNEETKQAPKYTL